MLRTCSRNFQSRLSPPGMPVNFAALHSRRPEFGKDGVVREHFVQKKVPIFSKTRRRHPIISDLLQMTSKAVQFFTACRCVGKLAPRGVCAPINRGGVSKSFKPAEKKKNKKSKTQKKKKK